MKIAALLCSLLLLSAAGCRDDAPIRIGYVGGLTGRTADLGLAGRDGVLLAVEQVNEAGGIGGRRVELLVRDDRQDPEAAGQAVQELTEAGVSAIIGPMTSEMALAAAPFAAKAGRVLLSPTASTPLLSGLDDFFFRIYPSSARPAEDLAEVARRRMKLARIAAVYDMRNRSHAETWYRAFAQAFRKLGGEVVAVEAFRSGSDASLFDLARRISATPSDAFLFVTSAMDTAILCQQLDKLGARRPVLTSEWAATDDLIAFGGKAVEGVTFFQTFNRESPLPRYAGFRKAFLERFRAEPRFASVHGYDAACILFAALARNPDPRRLPQTLLASPSYLGVQTPLAFTPDGDVRRPLFLTAVRDGRFALLAAR